MNSNAFKVGDKVVRTSHGYGKVALGDVVEVAGVWEDAGSISIKGDSTYTYDINQFALAKPVPSAPPKMLLSEDPQVRKDTPITSGVLDYFPLALAAVAQCSKVGNDQHNPGQPLHWAKGKSTDHADCIARHLIDRHTVDTDGVSHMVKLAWRALALLQTTLEAERAKQG